MIRDRDKLQNSRLETAKALASAAYSEVDRKYGKNGIDPKSYHNADHAKDVIKNATLIAEQAIKNGLLDSGDMPLVIIAGAYHDIEQDLGGGANEKASAGLALEAMRSSGIFSQKDIDRVSSAILATTVYFKDGIMYQSAGEDILERVIADADLANLGNDTERFWKKSLLVFDEENPTGENMDRFMDFDVVLLTNHKFYTSEAAKIFSNQANNLAYVKSLIIKKDN